MKTIGLDLSSEPSRPTGVGNYARALAGALGRATQSDLRLVAFAPPGLGLEGIEVVPTPFGERGYGPRRLFQQAALPGYAGLRGVDLLHSVNNLPPLAWPGKLVLSFQDAKLYHTAAGAGLLGRFYRRTLHRRGARRADLILVASEYSKREAVSALGVAPHKVRVVHYGVDAARFDPDRADAAADMRALVRYGLAGASYALVVATREPAKNLERALEAFAAVARERPELRLVLCGGGGWGKQDLEERAQRLGVAERVVSLGYVPDTDLPALYRGARAFLFPSLIEGFGLPILEAMAAGTPVVTSALTACPETAGGAALLVDPRDVKAIAAGLDAVLFDPSRSQWIERGRARAAAQTWERCAMQTLAVYREVLEEPDRRPHIHIASLLSPTEFYASAEGGASRDRALVEHLARRGGARVHYLARDRDYLPSLVSFLAAMALERDAVFYIQYPRMPTTLSTRGLQRLLREVFLRALRRAARRNRVLVDVSDLPVEQSRSLGLPLEAAEKEGFQSFERLLGELPVELVFTSRAMADYACEQRRLDPARVRFAINGAPEPFAAPARLPRKLAEDDGALRLVYVGTLRADRGVEVMLRTLLATRRPIRLVLIGPEGEWLSSHPDPRVRYLGPHDERSCQQLAQACDLALIPYDPIAQPYWQLAYPIKTSFYLALGLPILSTRVTEVERHLAETGAGIALPLEEWPGTLESLDTERLSSLTTAARAASLEFTWERILARLDLDS